MKEKQPKPKSVDECWMVEDESLNFLPILSATTFARAEALVKHLIFSDRHVQIVDSKYRIRKWRAQTVCEWKRVSLFSSNDGLQTGCNGKKLWAGHVDLDMHCYCGGKIRVRKN